MTKCSFYMGPIKTGTCDWVWYRVAFTKWKRQVWACKVSNFYLKIYYLLYLFIHESWTLKTHVILEGR